MEEEKVVAGCLMTAAIGWADSLRRITVKEQGHALVAEPPVPLTRPRRIVENQDIVETAGDLVPAAGWTPASFGAISIEEQRAALPAPSPIGLSRRRDYSRGNGDRNTRHRGTDGRHHGPSQEVATTEHVPLPRFAR